MTNLERVEQTLQLSDERTRWAHYKGRFAELQARELSAEGVLAWLRDWNAVQGELHETGSKLSVHADLHTDDPAAQERRQAFMAGVVPHASRAGQALTERLLAVPDFAPGPDFALAYRRLQASAALFREANVELGVKESELTSRHSALTGNQTVELGGERLTMPRAKERLDSPDRAVREAAWRAIAESNRALRPELDPLFLELLMLRRQLASNADEANYRDFRWKDLDRVDYTPEDCVAFHEAVRREVVPFAAENMGKIADALGLDSVRPWDYNRNNLLDPQGRAPLRPFAGGQELEELAQKTFAALDPELAERFGQMRRQGLLDLESRPGKMPHAYCAYFPTENQPFVLMNVVGTGEDVRVLFHEVGHAFHGFYSGAAQELNINRWSPIEFVEIPSMAMEFLTLDHLGHALGGDLERYQRQLLLGVVAFLPWAAQMDAFQHWLYAEAPDDVTAEQLDAKWLELDRAYHPFVDWEGLDESVRAKGWYYYHIFQVPFYYIEYAMCYLAAVSIWRAARAEPGQALDNYKAALKLGSTVPVPELYRAAGAEFRFDGEHIGGLMDFLRGELA